MDMLIYISSRLKCMWAILLGVCFAPRSFSICQVLKLNKKKKSSSLLLPVCVHLKEVLIFLDVLIMPLPAEGPEFIHFIWH